MATQIRTWRLHDLQEAGAERHLIVARAVAGLPLLVIGLAHVFDEGARMTPLVEAAGFPAATLLSPVAVALELIAGALLLAGLYARLGAALAIPVMLGAVYAHIAIDVWPNGADQEPPIVLPLLVIACAAYVIWRGAGRWSLDRRLAARRQD
jgi:putative oxidoreductase